MWFDLLGFEGYYQINKSGLIKSMSRELWNGYGHFKTKEKILKTFLASGYRKISLCKDSKIKKYFIHRLLAETFIGNPDNLPTVNHIDGNKMNNSVENLEWSSYKDQELHKRRIIHGKKRGVFTSNNGKNWYARIKNNEVYEHLGSFKKKEDAYDMFYSKYLEIHGVKPW